MKTELTINVRPLRHVYFIAEHDFARFTEVASFCCTQWGGINNLIFPVSASESGEIHDIIQKDSLFIQLINRRNPDIFIDAVSLTEGENSFYKSLMSWLASGYPRIPIINWDAFLRTDSSLHPLSIVSSQRNVSKPVLPIAVFPQYAKVPELENAIICAAFGRIWHQQERDYREVFELRIWPVDIPGASLQQQLSNDPFASVINLTLKELHNIGTEGTFPQLHFDIVVAQTVWDLCWFWNLRAYSFGHQWLNDRRVLILSKNQLLQEAYLEPLIRILRERRRHAYISSNVDVVFHHNHDDEINEFLRSRSELQQQSESFHINMQMPSQDNNSEEIHDESALSGDGTGFKPIMYVQNALPTFSVYHEYAGNRPIFAITLAEDSETFLVPNAGPRTASFGNVCIGLQSDFWNQFPCHSSVASLIVPDSSFNVFLNTIQLSYQQTLPAGGLGRVSITIPKTWEIYQAYFRSMGYDVSQSDKMFYANGLIGLAGGLEQAEILRSHLAYKILDTLADKSTQKLARELREQFRKQGLSIPRGFEEYLQGVVTDTGFIPQFKRNPRTFTKIKEALSDREDRVQCLKVLSELVRRKAVQRGLDIKCPHCQTTIWYGISALDERMKCLGCLETFDLPLTENALGPVDRSFQYSLNPLANRAMDQDVLPVITALLTLKRVHSEMHHLIPGMNFKKMESTDNAGDLDFVYVYKHELYGGECKAGEMLSRKDINTARNAHNLGFRAFFFITTKTFKEEAMELVQSYQQELANDKDMEHPYTIVILDKRTLFDGEPLSNDIPS